jgi:hypothetical protein
LAVDEVVACSVVSKKSTVEILLSCCPTMEETSTNAKENLDNNTIWPLLKPRETKSIADGVDQATQSMLKFILLFPLWSKTALVFDQNFV